MGDKEIRRVEDDGSGGQRSATGAILTGLAGGTANAVVTQTINSLRKPKDDKPKK